MTEQELRIRAKEEAAFCRSPEREGLCPFLVPGSGVAYEDCPMRPHKCGRVTAKMWLETWRDMKQLYGDLWDMWEKE